MVIALKLRVDDKLVRDKLGRIAAQIGPATHEEISQISKDIANAIAVNAKRKGLVWTGRLIQNIKSTRKGKSYNITMPLYGIYQDRMKPHTVALKRGRKITKWAREKGFNTKHVYVKPTPFIKAPLRQQTSMIRARMKKKLGDVVR